VYLVLCFDKSLPWPLYIHVPKISFYRNILCKNIVCDVGPSVRKLRKIRILRNPLKRQMKNVVKSVPWFPYVKCRPKNVNLILRIRVSKTWPAWGVFFVPCLWYAFCYQFFCQFYDTFVTPSIHLEISGSKESSQILMCTAVFLVHCIPLSL